MFDIIYKTLPPSILFSLFVQYFEEVSHYGKSGKDLIYCEKIGIGVPHVSFGCGNCEEETILEESFFLWSLPTLPPYTLK